MHVNEDHTLKEEEFEVQSVEEAYSKDFFVNYVVRVLSISFSHLNQ